MAFQTQQSTNTNTAGTNEQWKADAFINIYLPTSGGKRRKLGFIALKNARAFDQAVIDRLSTGGEEAIQALMKVMEVEFHTAEGEESAKPAF